jgi:YesN/AraC family two-component response regulator
VENSPVILIVDDEEYVLSSLKRLLRRDGYRILTALNGEEGFKLLSENDVQLVISDQRMPDMSGTEFLAKVKDEFPNAIRTIISGYTDINSITESVNKGHIYKFFYKPWDDNNLRLEIKQCLDQYELRRKNRELNEIIVEKNKELEHINDELVSINTNLESIVHQRTKDLEIQNQALELFRAIVEDMPLPVMGISSDGMIVMSNKKAMEITYGNAGFEVGNYIADCIPNNLHALIDKAIKDSELGEIVDYPIMGIKYKIIIAPLPGQFKGKGVTLIFV